jgi:EAL domain-containing protein (putative c-di-GMP-specific phosphodiesterase class I)
VEDAEQNAELKSLCCGNGQGYLYARPMPGHQFVDWLMYRAEE